MDFKNLLPKIPLSTFTKEQKRSAILSWVSYNSKIKLKYYEVPKNNPTARSTDLWQGGRAEKGNKVFMVNRIKQNISLHILAADTDKELKEIVDNISDGIIEQALIVCEDMFNAALKAKTKAVRKKYFNAIENIEYLKKIFKINSWISKFEDIEEIHSDLFEDLDDPSNKKNINIVKKVFDFTTFKEKIPNIINYKDGVLQFLNLGIEIDLKDKDIILTEWNERILNAILSKEDYKVSDSYLIEYLDKMNIYNKNTYKNEKVKFNKFIKILNEIIINELKEKNVNEADLRKFIEPPSNDRRKEKILYKVDNYYFD